MVNQGLESNTPPKEGSVVFLPCFSQAQLHQLLITPSLAWLWHSHTCSVLGFVCLCVFGLSMGSNCVVWSLSTPSSSYVLFKTGFPSFSSKLIGLPASLLHSSGLYLQGYETTRSASMQKGDKSILKNVFLRTSLLYNKPEQCRN